MRFKRNRRLFALFALVLLPACSSVKSFTDSYGRPTHITQMPEQVSSVAILPVSFADEDNTGYERLAAELLAEAVAQRGVSRVVRVESVISMFNDAGIADDYARLLAVYRNTGILDQPVLTSMTEATGAENFLYCTFAIDQEIDEAKNRLQVLVINAENWNTRLGDVSGEGRGVATDFVTWGDYYREEREPAEFDELILRAAVEVALMFY